MISYYQTLTTRAWFGFSLFINNYIGFSITLINRTVDVKVKITKDKQ
jgi:hypothetical protein